MFGFNSGRAARRAAMAWVATISCAAQLGAAVPDELICGFDNVEDMVALPGSRWIIGSGIGDRFFQGGGIHLFNQDTATGRKVLLAPRPDMKAQAPYDRCPAPADPAKFSAHGLALKANADGTQTLYVVNHGGRESIEVFRVTQTPGAPRFEWIGCVISPVTAMANAVAVRPDGSLVLSASFAGDAPMMPIHEIAATNIVMSPEQVAEASRAMKMGALFSWSREAGWKKITGSELEGNNGIELAAGGRWAFVDSHPGASVTYMPLEPGLGQPREIKLGFHPDNIRYGYDGKLVATGHVSTPERVGLCVVGNDPAHCAIDYRAARIDPQTFAVTEIFDGTGTPDFGVATVGLRTREALWLGPVRGHCIGKVALPPSR